MWVYFWALYCVPLTCGICFYASTIVFELLVVSVNRLDLDE